MNYSDIDRESNCLDQILIVIFVILIIFVIMFYLNPNRRNKEYEDFRLKKMNYARINYGNDDNLSNNDFKYDIDMINDPNVNNLMKSKGTEMADANSFLKRINNKEKFTSSNDNDDNDNYNDNHNERSIENFKEKFTSSNNNPVQDYENENENENERSIENFKVKFDNYEKQKNNNLDYLNIDSETQNKVNDLSNSEDISGFLNGDIACNMDQQKKELVDDYKKKYFKMYRHQIECPKDCQLHKLNLSRCNLADNNGCEGIFTKDYNNPDVFTLSNLILDRNNKRECVTCTANDDRQTINMTVPNSNVNEEDDVKINERRLNNRNKFADFNDHIDRNGVLETSVDKIAELRTANIGTCGLNSYGQKVSDVYNNLLSTTYTEDKNKCVQGQVQGINDNNTNDTYASVL